MGVSGSKVEKEISVEKIQEGSLPSTPILTPKTVRTMTTDLLDPRSPSTSISRTPLELYDGETSTDFEEVFETPSKNCELLLGVDPRSPTTDFVRTPIVINVTENTVPTKLKNKNLQKVLRSEIYTPQIERREINVIPPKFLGSSPVIPRSDAYKRKSFAGLLETNIDFTETDLDVVIQKKTNTNETPLQNRINIIENENVDPRSPTNDFVRTPIQIVKKIGEIELNDPETDLFFKCDPVEINDIKENVNEEEILEYLDESEGMQERLITQKQSTFCDRVNEQCIVNQGAHDELHAHKCNDIKTDSTNVSEHIDTPYALSVTLSQSKSAPVSPPNTKLSEPFNLSLNGSKSTPASPPLVNLTVDIKELDKKLTNLIYEDQDIIVCPRIVKLKDIIERSPLRSRNGIEPDRKSAQKLRVSGKPRKSDSGGKSRIPVYREKLKKGKVQCENTPPRCMDRKKQVRTTQWDNTNTTLYL